MSTNNCFSELIKNDPMVFPLGFICTMKERPRNLSIDLEFN